FTARIREEAAFHSLGSNSLAITVGALSAAAACLVHSLLDFNLHLAANVLVAAMIFGLLATPGEGPEAAPADKEPGWPPFLRLALPALGILLFVRVMPIAPAEFCAQQMRAILADWHRSVSAELNVRMEGLARRGLASDPRNP